MFTLSFWNTLLFFLMKLLILVFRTVQNLKGLEHVAMHRFPYNSLSPPAPFLSKS